MTFLGKFLVLVNVSFALLVATVSVVLYIERLDRVGEIAKLSEKIDSKKNWSLVNDLRTAEVRWTNAGDALVKMEPVPAKNLAGYVAQMTELEQSNAPLQAMAYDDKGVLPLDPQTSLPARKPALDKTNQPVQSAQFYANQLKALDMRIADVQKELDKLLGVKDRDDGNGGKINMDGELVKTVTEIIRVRTLRDKERFKVAQIKEELTYLKPLLYNTLVEKGLVEDRQEALLQRETELRKAKGLAAR